MKYAAVSIVSALLGAMVALLFAPSSGNELRSNIKNEMDTQFVRAKDELNKGVQDVQGRVDKLTSDLKGRMAEPKEPAKATETIA